MNLRLLKNLYYFTIKSPGSTGRFLLVNANWKGYPSCAVPSYCQTKIKLLLHNDQGISRMNTGSVFRDSHDGVISFPDAVSSFAVRLLQPFYTH